MSSHEHDWLCIDYGFDPDLDYGYYPRSQTARPLTDAERATYDHLRQSAAARPDHWAAQMVTAHLDRIDRISLGEPVSRIWIVHDPIEALLWMASSTAEHIPGYMRG